MDFRISVYCVLNIKFTFFSKMHKKQPQTGFVVSFAIVFILICSSMFDKVLVWCSNFLGDEHPSTNVHLWSVA